MTVKAGGTKTCVPTSASNCCGKVWGVVEVDAAVDAVADTTADTVVVSVARGRGVPPFVATAKIALVKPASAAQHIAMKKALTMITFVTSLPFVLVFSVVLVVSILLLSFPFRFSVGLTRTRIIRSCHGVIPGLS